MGLQRCERRGSSKFMTYNSLFGGENVVDIATPEIPVAERWSDLDRLNRERDLEIGRAHV